MTKLTDAEYTLTQVAEGVEEYYLGIGEAPGVWQGGWADKLGLQGVVEGDDLRSLLDGRHPTSGEDLLAGLPERTVKAFDATFSAPKSVSLLWTFATPHVAAVISIAHVEAVNQAVSLFETRTAVARQQRDGVRTNVATEGFVVAAFTHRTSRDGDPQLHTHCVIPNVVRRADGTCVSIAGHGLWEWKKAAGGVYQEQLRRLLTERLGVEWGPDRNGCREMLGFSAAQLRTFSKRTVQIERRLEAAGVDREDRVAWMRADEQASLATRPGKDKTLTPRRLQQRWLDEAARADLPVGVELEARIAGRSVEQHAPSREEVFSRLVDPDSGVCARRPRFGPADVVEHVAAMGAGQWTVAQISRVAEDFLHSDLAVRLVDRDPVDGRCPPRCWSTKAHLAMEHHVLDQLARLAATHRSGTDAGNVEAGIASAGRLGGDQVAAVRVLCGPGPALRALVAPAGYGKTTTVQVAAAVQQAAGRPVVAVAPTNQAVHELRAVGLTASTIARLRIDLQHDRLSPGTVLAVDEISQVATADAAWLLDTAANVPGGQLWLLGDSRQTGPVRAGGFAHEIERLAANGTIPAASLTVNRRQQDAAEREALSKMRAGDTAASQHIRTEHGWEHDHATPEATRQQMAAAVADDIDRYGAEQVVALAVSHADCEDIADRVRAVLARRGRLGPTVAVGPAWAGPGERPYAVGDRMLIHANRTIDGHRWHNGTVVTVTGATGGGISVTGPSGHGHPGQGRVLPAWFIGGRRPDGSPNVSHAWARTIDGAQGGTWTQVHLLATQALDATTGYVGQSRGRQATHTWNVAPHDDGDHGGVIAGPHGPAEQVLAAITRPDDSAGFAAGDDPYHLDRILSVERQEHQTVIAGRPQHVLPIDHAAAHANVERARGDLKQAEWRLGLRQKELDDIGPLSRITRHGRQRAAHAERDLTDAEHAVAERRVELTERERRLEQLNQRQAARLVWDHQHAWRIARVAEIDEQLVRHWADTVLAAVRVGDPLAYGLDRLRAARHTTSTELARLDAAIPADQTRQLAEAKADVAHWRANRQWAQRQVAHAEERLTGLQAHPGRRERSLTPEARAAVQAARADLDQSFRLENQAARKVRDLAQGVAARQQALADTAQQRQDLTDAVRQLSAAVDHARAQRVHAAARGEIGHDHLYEALGVPPRTRGGLAAWCALADRVEHQKDTASPTNHDSQYSYDSAARMAQRLPLFSRAESRDERLIADAADIIDAASQLDPRPAPDPAAINPGERNQILNHAADVQRAPTVERGLGLELGL